MNKEVQITADGGSSKTEWRITFPDGKSRFLTTSGINPTVMTPEQIRTVLNDELLPKLTDLNISQASTVNYYGAGVVPEAAHDMATHLRETLPLSRDAQVSVGSDLLGACHALFGNHPGIVGILGTGSNSCYYDGQEIVDAVPSLGYILGDEGSGAYLGRWLINSVYKRQLSENVIRAFGNAYPNLTVAEIITRVYRSPSPNAYLASFAPFLAQQMWDPEIALALKNAFRAFFRRNLALYSSREKLPLGLLGSIAWYFSKPIRIVAREERFHRPTFRLSPLHPTPED